MICRYGSSSNVFAAVSGMLPMSGRRSSRLNPGGMFSVNNTRFSSSDSGPPLSYLARAAATVAASGRVVFGPVMATSMIRSRSTR